MNAVSMTRSRSWLLIATGFMTFACVPLVYLPRVYVPVIYNYIPLWKEILVCIPILAIVLSRPRFLQSSDVYVLLVGLISVGIAMSFSIVSNETLILSVLGSIPYLIYILLYFMYALLELDELESISIGAALSTVVLSLGIIYDYFTGRYLSLELSAGETLERTFSKLGDGVIRPSFLFTSSTVASVCLASLYCLALSHALKAQSARSKVFWSVVSVVGLMGVLFTLSRIGYVGVLVVSVGAAVAILLINKQYVGLNFRRALGVVVLAISIFILLPVSVRQNVFERIGKTFTANALGDVSNQMRVMAWGDGVDFFTDSVVVGNGIGQTQGRMRRYGSDLPHFESAVLSVFVETGVLMVPYMFLCLFRMIQSYLSGVVNTLTCKGSLWRIYCIFPPLVLLFMSFANPLLGSVFFSSYLAFVFVYFGRNSESNLSNC